MPLAAGTLLGSYEILAPLGEGGMGEVYRARDTKLGREVALKLVRSSLAGDPEYMLRFQREARLLAALNHPNIAAIYGLEEAGTVHALVMELVNGQTLAERLVAGPMPLDEALSVAKEIAGALEAAHEKGIIHRDLKPANVKITPEGVVKVLDFGLAKAMEKPAASGDPSLSPTLTKDATEFGSTMGTPGYMSPEQARGKPLDKRADVWSFGCVLYKALSGRPAFSGETRSDTMVAVLRADLDWDALPASTPIQIRRLLQRCLRKDVQRRLRDMGDARLEIEEALADLSAAQPVASTTSPTNRSISWSLVGLLAILTGLLGWWLANTLRKAPASQVVGVRRLTDFSGLEEFPALSPDGKSVAFTADLGGTRQIWVRLLSGGAPLQITRDPADHQSPRWSPDSGSLIYYSPSAESGSQGTLWETSALGGVPRRIVPSFGGGDLSHDGKHLAFFRFHDRQVELHTAARDGSSDHVITRLPAEYRILSPRWSPDDRSIAYQRGRIFEDDVYAVSVDGGDARRITQDGKPMNGFAWLPDGSGVVYSSARASTILYLPPFNLWLQRTDGTQPRQLTFGEVSYTQPDAGPGGQLTASRLRIGFDIWKFPVNGSGEENVLRGVRLTRQTGQVQTPSTGPEDRELTYLSDSGGHGNLWLMKQDGTETRQITYEQDPGTAVGLPVWSPDGKQIAFVSTRGYQSWDFGIWLVNPDGSALRNLVEHGGWACWSGDSRWVYYAVSRQGVYHIEKLPAEGGPAVTVRTDNAIGPAVASDASAIYYAVPLANVNDVPDYEIRVARPENRESQPLARIPGGRIPSAGWTIHPVLSPDDKTLAVLLADGAGINIWTLPATGGNLRQVTDFGPRRTLIARRVSWSSDSRFLVAAVGESDSDIVLLDALALGR